MTVQEAILDVFESRLASMTVVNGYSRTVGKIVRATLKPFSDGDLPACNYWPGTDIVVERGNGFEVHELSLSVEYYDKTRDQPFSDIVFRLGQDVRIALHRAVASPRLEDQYEPTLGGKVLTLQVESIVPQVGEGQAPWCGALVTLTARYRVKVTDPTIVV